MAKILTATFSIATVISGLAIIGFCFYLVLETDWLMQDYESQDEADEQLYFDRTTKRVAIVVFTSGCAAVIYGLLGICAAKVQKAGCTCVYGIGAFLLLVVFAITSIVILSFWYVKA